MKNWGKALYLRIFDKSGWVKESEWFTGGSVIGIESSIRGNIKRIRWIHTESGLRWENDWIV